MDDRERLPPAPPGGAEDLEGTVAAYLLGALPPEEARAFERELARRPAAARLLAEWRLVVEALPLTIEEVAPPPGLRARILDAAAAVPTGEMPREAGPGGP